MTFSPTSIVLLVLVVFSLTLTAQAAYTLYMMLYTWDQPAAEAKARVPEVFIPPQTSFTVMLPARHEEEVIQTTIERVVKSNYPAKLLEVIVICSADDTGTIGKAQEKIDELRRQGLTNVRVIVFDDKPINKPHGMNVALRQSRHDVVTIFDAEDDIHPEIFNVANTVLVQERVQVLQAGVQLMNYQSNWYSTLNVLEYFFWFKSRLHYHAKYGSIPLGGNTVFFAREILERVGGWDESNLTEDADIGMRISALGVPVRVVYDHRYVTREETPPTLGHFIRQRTRWSQGFMQTLAKGEWKKLPTFEQRFLAFFSLAFPNAQGALGVYTVVSLLMIVTVKAPVLVAMLSFLPLLMIAAHFMTAVIGLYEFTSAHGLKPSWKTPVIMALTYIPYQWVLSYAALRALRRQMMGIGNWEKTQHTGAHRQPEQPSQIAA